MAEAVSHSGSSSSSSSEEADEGHHKRRRLQLPAGLGGGQAPAGPRDEDPALHQGRKRRVPHVEGNFATSVYLKVRPTARWQRRASDCVGLLRQLMPPGGVVHLTDESSGLGWHVSLSPLLMLRQQFIGPLLRLLEKAAASVSTGGPLFFSEDIEVLTSHGGDRYFAAVPVAEASAPWLRELAKKVQEAAGSLGFMEGPPAQEAEALRLHCSLAWTLADLQPGLASAGAEEHRSRWGIAWRLPPSGRGSGASSAWPLRTAVRAGRVRIGDRDHQLPLRGGGGFDVSTSEEEEEEDAGEAEP